MAQRLDKLKSRFYGRAAVRKLDNIKIIGRWFGIWWQKVGLGVKEWEMCDEFMKDGWLWVGVFPTSCLFKHVWGWVDGPVSKIITTELWIRFGCCCCRWSLGLREETATWWYSLMKGWYALHGENLCEASRSSNLVDIQHFRVAPLSAVRSQDSPCIMTW